jgi:hypothetical protein
MLKTVLTYNGRIWLNKIDSLVGKAKNGRYFRKFRLVVEDSGRSNFFTLTVFADKASELFTLPETLVVRNLPVHPSQYQQGDKTYTVYATELKDLLQHMQDKK